MKKQILILTFLSLAFVFAGITKAWAQEDPYLAPTPLECIDLTDGLRPVPGQNYIYDINVPAPDGTKTYRWFVTTDVAFMAGTDITLDREDPTNSDYLQWAAEHYDVDVIDGNTDGWAGDSISLRWNSFTLDPAEGEYLFVVVYVENEDADGCITDNLKVYRILPTHAFTLDLAAIDPSDDSVVEGDDPFEVCVDIVQSATFNPDHGDNGGVVYDFGQNTFYWVVAAANFSHGYQLSIQFNGLQGPSEEGTTGQEATLFWSDTFNGEDNSITFDWTDVAIEQVLGDISGSASQEGQMLYIKVVIDHNHFEAAGQPTYPYELAVDGVLLDSDGNLMDPNQFGDLHHQELSAGDGCDQDGFDHDRVTQNLKQRPTLEEEQPDPFLPIGGE